MKKFIIILVVFLGIDSCNSDKEFLNVPPLNILTQETVFNDPALALSVLGDLYNRAVDFTSLKTGWLTFTDFGESFPSDGSTVSNTTWDYTSWSLYEYGYVRDLNLFIDSNKSKIVSNKNLQITILDTAGIGGQSTLEFQPGSAPLSGDAPTPTLLPSGTWNIGASSRRFNQIYTVISNATTLKVDSIVPSTPAATSVTVATDLIVSGNFTVNGTTTTINSTQTAIHDLVVTLAKGAANPTAANGAGIEIDGAGATLTYTVAGNKWNVNKDLDAGTNNFITSGAFQGTATAAR